MDNKRKEYRKRGIDFSFNYDPRKNGEGDFFELVLWKIYMYSEEEESE